MNAKKIICEVAIMTKKSRALWAFLLLAVVLSLGCPVPPPQPPEPPPQPVKIEVCAESLKLPTSACPEKKVVEFKPAEVPTMICPLHPEPAPKVKVCSETGMLWLPTCGGRIAYVDEPGPGLVCRKHRRPRPVGVPFMVLFVVDLGSAAHLFPDAELEIFAQRLGAAGCDYIRMFSCWKRPGGREYTLPFERVDGKADWDKPDPEWDRQLARLQRILGRVGVGIYLDLFAQQFDRRDYPWSPFWNNTDGIGTWRATSPKAMKRWKQLIDRAVAAIGVEGNLFGWGNELVHPDDPLGDTVPQDNWAKAWAVPLAAHLRSRGIPPPNPFSASDNMHGTGHSIYNRLVKQAGWEQRDTFWVLHGVALAEHFDRFAIGSALKNYGVSDDGIGLNPAVIVPPEKQGLTVSQTGRRSSHWTYRIQMVRHVKEKLGDRFRLIEVMAFSLKWDTWMPSMLHQEEEVDVFWKIALQIYGKDIRRPL